MEILTLAIVAGLGAVLSFAFKAVSGWVGSRLGSRIELKMPDGSNVNLNLTQEMTASEVDLKIKAALESSMQNTRMEGETSHTSFSASPASWREARHKTALGLEDNLSASLGYLIGIVALILLVTEKKNHLVRFHALQSVLYHVAWLVLFVALNILSLVLRLTLGNVLSNEGWFDLVLKIVWVGFGLAYLASLIVLGVKAYRGSLFSIPFIGTKVKGIQKATGN